MLFYFGIVLANHNEKCMRITIQDIITYFTVLMTVAMIGIFLYKRKASKP